MNIEQLVSGLTKLGYEVKKISGKTVDVTVETDRVGALVNIAKSFGGKHNPRGGSSSVGRAELPNGFYVNAKPSGGGSGAGSAITQLTESAQCLYCAAAWYAKDYSKDTLKSVADAIEVDENIDNIVTKLPDTWVKSCILTAEILKKEFNRKRYKFHRGSMWVDSLQNHWTRLNREEKAFSNLNKWSPADIYMISQAGERIDVTKTKSIQELNLLLKKALKDRDIIGVSLKQVQSNPTLAYKNLSTDRSTYKFKSLTTGKRGFFNSNDSYVEFDGGNIQFRTFGTTWQGEIKGKTANMGKISGGPIASVLSNLSISGWLPQNQITVKTDRLVDQMYSWYKTLVSPALSKSDFIAELSKKDQTFWVSKFMSTQLMYFINQSNKKDEIVSAMISYAASESELSGPYVKVS